MNLYDILIIGGGASGLIAALTACDLGKRVLILEKNNRIGKKILVTGNGRCNFTNIFMVKDDYNNPEFVEKTFEQFNVQNTIDFFDSLGIVAKIEDEGKTYPLSEQASSFLDVFLYELNNRKIDVELNQEIININKTNDYFNVYAKGNVKYQARKVIICTGGKSMPLTGSDGSGYDLAEKLGHRINRTFPALVKLKLDSPHLKHLSGVKINSQVDLLLENKIIKSEHGDILFTSYGISGPTILELSRKANELLNDNKEIELRVILVESVSKKKILERLNYFSNKEVSQSLIGLVNKRFITPLLREAGIEKNNVLVKELDSIKIFNLINLLYDWRFKIIGSLGFEESQVTAGGIDIKEINPQTLESNLVENLYFAGEIIDIDGRCGGFNLQWAWSSGYVAAKHASDEK